MMHVYQLTAMRDHLLNIKGPFIPSASNTSAFVSAISFWIFSIYTEALSLLVAIVIVYMP